MYCVLVKPSYNIKYVERLYHQVSKNLSYDFQMICLTDSIWKTSLPISFVNVSKYGLDTWWNKVAIFDSNISGNGKNLYFDLDINITGNLDFLLEDLDDDNIYVVDTLWKDGKQYAKKNDGFFHYGNTSVIGWIGKKHTNVFKSLIDNPFITIEHFGDDSYINKQDNIKYFKPLICHIDSKRYMLSMKDKRIIIHFKDPP